MEHSILVVDDDQAIRELLSLILEGAGFQVFVAGDGVEALALVGRQKLDLILLDLQMPRMNGWEFAKQLRLQPHYSQTPIIVCTASGRDPIHSESFEIHAWLSKPFDVADLLTNVGKALNLTLAH